MDVGEEEAGATLVEGHALVGGYVFEGAQSGGVLGQLAPGFAGSEVEHDETIAAFVTAIIDVADSFAGDCGVCSHVEAQVVHVRIWVVDGGGESKGRND